MGVREFGTESDVEDVRTVKCLGVGLVVMYESSGTVPGGFEGLDEGPEPFGVVTKVIHEAGQVFTVLCTRNSLE